MRHRCRYFPETQCRLFDARVQADDPKEAAKGIIARAAARGIIAGVQEKLSTVQEEHAGKKQNLQRKDAKRKTKKTSKQTADTGTTKTSSVGILVHSVIALSSTNLPSEIISHWCTGYRPRCFMSRSKF